MTVGDGERGPGAQPVSEAVPVPTPHWPLPVEWLPHQGRADQLVVLLHGWASDARAMQPLAQALRALWPQAAILLPQAEQAADAGRRGLQWYSINGLEVPGLWAARVVAATAQLQAWLHAQQLRLAIGPSATTLGGFSQGGILALALAQHDPAPCSRVLSFGGCLVQPPTGAMRGTALHLFHGGADHRIPTERSRQAHDWFAAIGADVTLDIADGVGHVLHPTMIEQALRRLSQPPAPIGR